MDWNFALLTVLPAGFALLAKASLFAYAYKSGAKAQRTKLFLYLLIVLFVQNIVVIPGFFALKDGVVPIGEATIFYACLFASISLLYHLAYATALEGIRHDSRSWTVAAFHVWAVALGLMLLFTDQLVTGYTHQGYVISRIPGPLYFLFELFAGIAFTGTLSLLVYGSWAQRVAQRRLRSTAFLLAIVPMVFAIALVLVLFRLGVTTVNFAVVSPLVITYFLVVTAYATHQNRLFDIQFYIPWSKVRKRKTAFYDRIRAMIAEIADLRSVNEAVDRLADTLRCPVALVGGPKLIAATAMGNMGTMPTEQLRVIDEIVVANEIADRMPQVHAAMKQHGVAAIVPFYPHSNNASSWLLLGDSFSEQVYTPLDFRMVEKLFDRMADLFLDKLLSMRTQLADAHSQIQVLEFRLKGAEANAAALEQKVESLSRDNTRLLREQPADSLLGHPRNDAADATITLLGRDKTLLKQLRERFPQLEQYASPESTSFKRRPRPAVLLCQVEADAVQHKLLDLLNESAHESAILLFGGGAAQFAFERRQELLGKLVEVLPDQTTAEGLSRKVEALVQLRTALTTMAQTDVPLLGSSTVFEQAITEATRIAGFSDPVCIETVDFGEAAALASYMHHRARSGGSFRILRTARLTKHESRDDTAAIMSELDKVLTETTGGTLLIDNLGALSNEIWDHILLRTNEFANIRMIAACQPNATRSPTELFKPLQPLILRMPSLRERRADLPLLIHYYTLQFNLQAASSGYLSQSDIDDLMVCNYPTDLAALRSAVFDALRGKPGRQQQPPEIPELQIADSEKSLEAHVAEFEASLIAQTLERCGGNKSKAARMLNMRPNTLHYKLERYGLLANKP